MIMSPLSHLSGRRCNMISIYKWKFCSIWSSPLSTTWIWHNLKKRFTLPHTHKHTRTCNMVITLLQLPPLKKRRRKLGWVDVFLWEDSYLRPWTGLGGLPNQSKILDVCFCFVLVFSISAEKGKASSTWTNHHFAEKHASVRFFFCEPWVGRKKI